MAIKQVLSLKKIFRLVWNLISTLTTILGLAGLTDDIVQWSNGVRDIYSYYKELVHPIVLPIVRFFYQEPPHWAPDAMVIIGLVFLSMNIESLYRDKKLWIITATKSVVFNLFTFGQIKNDSINEQQEPFRKRVEDLSFLLSSLLYTATLIYLISAYFSEFSPNFTNYYLSVSYWLSSQLNLNEGSALVYFVVPNLTFAILFFIVMFWTKGIKKPILIGILGAGGMALILLFSSIVVFVFALNFRWILILIITHLIAVVISSAVLAYRSLLIVLGLFLLVVVINYTLL